MPVWSPYPEHKDYPPAADLEQKSDELLPEGRVYGETRVPNRTDSGRHEIANSFFTPFPTNALLVWGPIPRSGNPMDRGMDAGGQRPNKGTLG